MTTVDEALRRSYLITVDDPEIVHAVDAKELRGAVIKRLPGLTTAARVLTGDLEDWRAKRIADYGSALCSEETSDGR